MNSGAQIVKDEAAPASFSRPKVVTQFSGGYVPPFDVATAIEKMLDTVPPKFLNGLGEIVLTNTASLPRKQRRSTTKSRGRKLRQAEARGLYYQAWNGRSAWIKIYVDNALGVLPRGWLRWLWSWSMIQEGELSRVIFHEIGHHIHTTLRPEHREKEDVADVWKLRLERNYIRQQHPILKRLFRIVIRVFGPVYQRFYRRTMEHGLAKGWMSRAEFDESFHNDSKS